MNGSRVFFISKAELTENAETGPADNAANLYEYDLEDHQLTDLTVDTKDSDGAGVLGVTAINEDGSYVYFVAEGELAAGAAVGKPNLYLEHEGTIAFDRDAQPHRYRKIGLPEGNPSLNTVRETPDGTHLAFLSTSSLTGYDNEQAETGECESTQGRRKAVGVARCLCMMRGRVCWCAHRAIRAARVQSDLQASVTKIWTAYRERRVYYTPRNFSEDGSRLFFQSQRCAGAARQ